MAVFRFKNGFETTVDDDDLEILKQPGWTVKIAGRRMVPYVYRNLRGVKTPEYLHRTLAGARPGDVVRHLDNNTLNNRKKNFMRVVPVAKVELVDDERMPMRAMRKIQGASDEELKWRLSEAFGKLGITINVGNILVAGDRVLINASREEIAQVLGTP